MIQFELGHWIKYVCIRGSFNAKLFPQVDKKLCKYLTQFIKRQIQLICQKVHRIWRGVNSSTLFDRKEPDKKRKERMSLAFVNLKAS